MASLTESLRTELKKRSLENGRYSLRAFARDLGVAPSYLCKLLNNQIELTLNKFIHLSDKLQMSREDFFSFKENEIRRAVEAEVKKVLLQSVQNWTEGPWPEKNLSLEIPIEEMMEGFQLKCHIEIKQTSKTRSEENLVIE